MAKRRDPNKNAPLRYWARMKENVIVTIRRRRGCRAMFDTWDAAHKYLRHEVQCEINKHQMVMGLLNQRMKEIEAMTPPEEE
jgi:hypothetical protein